VWDGTGSGGGWIGRERAMREWDRVAELTGAVISRGPRLYAETDRRGKRAARARVKIE
jgi:hypothetical protein